MKGFPSHVPAVAFLMAVAALSSACVGWWWGDVPYLPTPNQVVDRMLRMAKVGPGDVVYDLGSGDGRIVIAAVRDYKAARAVGVEIDSLLIYRSQQNAEAAGVSERTKFVQQDLFKMDFSEASVVTMFLLREINLRLRPRILSGLRPGTRVVSHRFDMGDWQPDERSFVNGRSVYLWIVPAQVAGSWRWMLDGQDVRIDLTQNYQKIEGILNARADGAPVNLEKATLTGDRLRFTARIPRGSQTIAMHFDGRVEGTTLAGDLTVDGLTSRVEATRVN